MYASFDTALASFKKRPTHFEAANGITVQEFITVLDVGDMKLVATKCTNGESGLIIFFKTSTKYDSWLYWMPSKNQQEHLALIAFLLRDVEQEKARRLTVGLVNQQY